MNGKIIWFSEFFNVAVPCSTQVVVGGAGSNTPPKCKADVDLPPVELLVQLP